MTILHHPGEDVILAYANGSLKRALALVLGAHLESCALCRESLALAEELGGVYLLDAPPADLSGDALGHVLERLEKPASPSISVARPFSRRVGEIGKRYWLAPGVWIHPLLKDGPERAYFLGAAPGKKLPRHGHKGVEMTQVLQGEFFDAATRYGAGDFLEAGEEVEHALHVGPDAPCVCLIASEGVPRGLPGLLMRLVA
ncbi:MAG TPA: cupin domain-containing protein [Rhizomicrobium sp.]|nr:cupin domain-containing protein [Rhizomicrobium sp.]HWC62924.1 cupin domain-containing protein [Rhizomicrobium sp.]